MTLNIDFIINTIYIRTGQKKRVTLIYVTPLFSSLEKEAAAKSPPPPLSKGGDDLLDAGRSLLALASIPNPPAQPGDYLVG
jgi:hypothetical protein